MDNIYESKILIMIVLKTFTCRLTGDELQIVRYNDGTEVCQPYTPPTEDCYESEAICIEYLLS